MPSRGVLAATLLAVLAVAGCMISEQSGHMPQKLPGMGSGYTPAEDVVYHFASGFNWGIVLGRSGLLIAASSPRGNGR